MSRPRLTLRLVLGVSAGVLALGLTGCAMIWPTGKLTHHSAAAQSEVLDDGHDDHPGVIHVHTTYSHDAHGTFAEMVRVANAQGLHYVITTEHNNLRSLRDGNQGWHGMTLVLVGEELSTGAGHYLALGVRDEVDRFQPTQTVIDEVARQGGLGFIAHPYFKKHPWKDWSVTGMTGIEGYNTTHDAFDENWLRLALWGITVPPDPLYLSLLDRPYDPLARWDALIQSHGRIVGIGSSDAHQVEAFGLKFAPYDIMFKLIRTHLLTPAGSTLSEGAVYDALRNGHAYFSLDLLEDAGGFTFMADDGQRVRGIMGDEIELVEPLQLTVLLPQAAELTLLQDGRIVATNTERTWHYQVTQPGAYRVEVSRHGKPWIFSNPIYIRPPLTLAPPDAPAPEPAQPPPA